MRPAQRNGYTLNRTVKRTFDEDGKVTTRTVLRAKGPAKGIPGSSHVLRSNLLAKDASGAAVNVAQTETIIRQR